MLLMSTHNICLKRELRKYVDNPFFWNFEHYIGILLLREVFEVLLMNTYNVCFNGVITKTYQVLGKKVTLELRFNSFPASGDFCCLLASGDFCCLLIIFANSLDPDQARQHVGPDLDPNCLTLWWYSWKIFLKKLVLKKKKSKNDKKACKITQHANS